MREGGAITFMRARSSLKIYTLKFMSCLLDENILRQPTQSDGKLRTIADNASNINFRRGLRGDREIQRSTNGRYC